MGAKIQRFAAQLPRPPTLLSHRCYCHRGSYVIRLETTRPFTAIPVDASVRLKTKQVALWKVLVG